MPVAALLPHVNTQYGLSLTRGWENYFLQKHADILQIAKSSPEEDNRLIVPQAFLNSYISLMTSLSGKFCAELCFNLDEMGSAEYEDRKTQDVIVSITADPDAVQHSVSRSIHHQTLLAAVSAAGDHLIPFIITSTDINQKMHLLGYRPGHDAIFEQRHVPYMDSRIFMQYLEGLLIPYINEKRQDPALHNKPALLFLDSCSCHVTPEVKAILAQNCVLMFCFPPHTTNIFQPLDLVLFGVIKNILKNLERDSEVNKQAGFAAELLQAFEKAMTSANIRGAFERAGMVLNTENDPCTLEFNPEKLNQNSQFIKIYNQNIPLEAVSLRRRNQPYGFVNLNEFHDYFPGLLDLH